MLVFHLLNQIEKCLNLVAQLAMHLHLLNFDKQLAPNQRIINLSNLKSRKLIKLHLNFDNTTRLDQSH